MSMKIPASKAELLSLIEEEHAEIDRWLVTLDDTLLATAGLPSGWTPEVLQTGVEVKDILAHLTAWEKRMLAYMDQQHTGKPLAEARFTLTAPKFNRAVFEENRHRPAGDILKEYRESYATVLTTLQSLDEETLRNLNAGGLISYNTYSHYRWASKKIRPWARKQISRT